VSGPGPSEPLPPGTLGRHTLRSLPPRERSKVLLALVSLYLFWGSTYYAIRVAIDAFPPLVMAGARHLAAGLVLLPLLLLRGSRFPDPQEWGAGFLVGTLLLLGGNGGVSLAEQWVGTGLSSLVVATVPLWMLLFAGFLGHRATRREWLGIGLGLAGVGLLSLEGDFAASPLGFLLLVGASVSWAFGSIWSSRLPMAPGLMGAATQMLGGGLVMLGVGFSAGERWPSHYPPASVAGWLYLVVFGSLFGFTAFLYLLNRVRPALTSSYAYVNPVIAMVLGMTLLGERLSPLGVAATAVILGGVALTLSPRRGVP